MYLLCLRFTFCEVFLLQLCVFFHLDGHRFGCCGHVGNTFQMYLSPAFVLRVERSCVREGAERWRGRLGLWVTTARRTHQKVHTRFLFCVWTSAGLIVCGNHCKKTSYAFFCGGRNSKSSPTKQSKQAGKKKNPPPKTKNRRSRSNQETQPQP